MEGGIRLKRNKKEEAKYEREEILLEEIATLAINNNLTEGSKLGTFESLIRISENVVMSESLVEKKLYLIKDDEPVLMATSQGNLQFQEGINQEAIKSLLEVVKLKHSNLRKEIQKKFEKKIKKIETKRTSLSDRIEEVEHLRKSEESTIKIAKITSLFDEKLEKLHKKREISMNSVNEFFENK